jgi:large subunit ribosomal protein L20
MVRATYGPPSRQKRNRRLKLAKGYWGGRHRLWRTVNETLIRAWAFSTAHRKLKKREYRGLWIIRVAAASEMRGMPYSQLIDGLNKAGITLNRKQLSELAIHDPIAFDKLVEEAKSARAAAVHA